MTLEDAVDLVMYAFKNGGQGDLFVQKAPACTISDLATALKDLFHAKNEIRVIGTRHGEKLFETLVNREEMVRAKDLGDYFRILADERDLNYDQYFIEGRSDVSLQEDYTSHNTTRLDIDDTKNLLLKLNMIKNEVR